MSLIDKLSLDSDAVDLIKNNNILEINKPNLRDHDVLKSLDIDPYLDSNSIKEKLATEFQKWNNRYNIVPSDQRDEIQLTIDKIAQVSKQAIKLVRINKIY